MLKNSKVRKAAGAVLILIGIAWVTVIIWRSNVRSVQRNLDPQGLHPGSSSFSKEYRSKGAQRMPSKRERELDIFRLKWDDLNSRVDAFALTGEDLKLVEELARVTVTKLECSPEMVGLIQYLNSKGYSPSLQMELNKAISELFKSDRRDKVRAQVLLLSADQAMDPTESKALWSCYAGAGCSKDELNLFLENLQASEPDAGQGARLRQDALLAYGSEIVSEDPQAVAILLSEQSKQEIKSLYGDRLMEEITKKLPDDTDFQAMESVLLAGIEEGIKDRPNVRLLQEYLIRRWTEIAPADVANYVMDHAEVFGSGFISTVAGRVTKKNSNIGYDWAQTFPQGEYRDAALFGAVTELALSPERGMDLAEQIEDPKKRRNAIEFAQKRARELERFRNRQN